MNRKFIWWLGFVTLFVFFSVSAYGQWPTYHKDFQRGGVSGASIDPTTLTLDWFFQPGVGNPLNPGAPNGTGIPELNGGQSAVVGFGKVFYGYNDNTDQDVLVALDASSGAYLWSKVIRFAGLGGGFVPVPTVAVRDTGGPAPDTAVYVYGVNNSVWALNANTGATLWNRTGINAGGASMNSGAPAVFDTTLICHDNGGVGLSRRIVTALNVRNGTTVWSSNDGVSTIQMFSRMFLGPALSNDTVFVAGRAAGTIPGGSVHMLDAKTGLLLGTYVDPDIKRYQNGVVVFDDNLIAISRNEAFDGFSSSIQVWKNTHDVTPGPTYQRTPGFAFLNRFSTPEVYVEPSVGETVVVYGTIDSPRGGRGEIVMFKVLPGPGIPTRSLVQTAGAIHGPGAVAAGNGLLLQGDDAGYWYALDANSYGAFFGGGLTPFWHKQFPSHITAGAAISPEDDTLVVIMDGNGNAAGWRNGHVTSRPRVQTYLDLNLGFFGIPRTEVVLGIVPTDPVAGTGGSSDTTLALYQNIGNEPLTYELDWGSSPVVLSWADLGGLGASISLGRTHPTRERMALSIADDNTVTSADAFLEKKLNINNRSLKRSLKDALDLEADGVSSLNELRDLTQKATYFGSSKLQEAKAKLTQTGWLFVNDLNGGAAAAGADITLRLAAINPDVGFGQFFGEIKLFNTNEPDAQGNPLDTTRISVVLVIGFLGERCNILADDTLPTGLTKTNYGRDIGQDGDVGFAWHGNHVGFDGGFLLGNSDTTFAGLWGNFGSSDPPVASAAGVGFKSDSICQVGESTYTEGASVNIAWFYTKLAHVFSGVDSTALPLIVRQYGWAFRDPITAYAQDVIYQTFVVICTSTTGPCTGIMAGIWSDLDVSAFSDNFHGRLDNQDAVWQYDGGIPNELFGFLRVPGDNIEVSGTDLLVGTDHTSFDWLAYDEAGLFALWDTTTKADLDAEGRGADMSSISGSAKFDLGPGEHRAITYVWFGADTTGESGNTATDLVEKRFRDWLRLAGYFRGDTKGNGGTQLDDVVYLINYVTKGGPAPLPFSGQGDVDGDGLVDAADISYLYDFVRTADTDAETAAPIDYDRFVPAPYKNTRPGLSNDSLWCD